MASFTRPFRNAVKLGLLLRSLVVSLFTNTRDEEGQVSPIAKKYAPSSFQTSRCYRYIRRGATWLSPLTTGTREDSAIKPSCPVHSSETLSEQGTVASKEEVSLTHRRTNAQRRRITLSHGQGFRVSLSLDVKMTSLYEQSSHSLSRMQAYISGHASHPSYRSDDSPLTAASDNETSAAKKGGRRVQVNMAVQIREYYPFDAPGILRRTDSATELLSDHPNMQTQKPLGRLRVSDFEVISNQKPEMDEPFGETSRVQLAS